MSRFEILPKQRPEPPFFGEFFLRRTRLWALDRLRPLSWPGDPPYLGQPTPLAEVGYYRVWHRPGLIAVAK